VIERRRIWTGAALAGYIRDELGFPGARQGVMVEKEAVDIAAGEVSRERWYPLTSLSSRRCGPKELLRGFRNHWSVENSLHHVKDRSWDEDVHTLRRPGLGEVYATLVNTALNALRLEGWFPLRMSMPLRAKTCAFRPMQAIDRLYGRPS
jgi:predicted transposase YbfD/YdcC